MTVGRMASMQNAYRSLYVNQTQMNRSMRNLSSGYRINSAADDAAGLAISERMRGQIGGLNKATENATQAVSLMQTAEGGLDSTTSALRRMRELAVQASNGTYSDADRALLDKEFQSLVSHIDQVASSAHYNGIKLLDGSLGGTTGTNGLANLGISDISVNSGVGSFVGNASFEISVANGVTSITGNFGGEVATATMSGTDAQFNLSDGSVITMDFAAIGNLQAGTIEGVAIDATAGTVDFSGALGTLADSGITFQIGANGGQDQRVSMTINDMSAAGLNIAGLDITNIGNANSAIDAIDAALNAVNSQRSSLGAMQNRMEHTINNLGVTTENLYASESRIRDADMAKEMMEYTQRNIMVQAAQAMMAQGMNLNRSYMLGLLMR